MASKSAGSRQFTGQTVPVDRLANRDLQGRRADQKQHGRLAGSDRGGRLDRLDQLRELNGSLRDFLTAYGCSQDLANSCLNIDRRLTSASKDQGEALKSEFWEGILENVRSAESCMITIPGPVPDACESSREVETLVDGLVKVREAANRAVLNPGGGDSFKIVGDSWREIRELKRLIDTLRVRLKQGAENLLREMETVISDIRHMISLNDELASKQLQQGGKTASERMSRRDDTTISTNR